MRLRTHLVILVLAALVPVLGFVLLLVRENSSLQLAATERGMRETAHAVAATVDKTLESAITTLEALAESDDVDTRDLRAFHRICQRIVRAQGWSAILLFDPGGRTLMQTDRPLGAPRPAPQPPALVARARETRKPAVSDLFASESHGPVVAIYVPVVRDTQVRFVMAATMRASELGDLLRAQQFGEGTVAVLQDTDNVTVARSQGEAEMVGQRIANPTPGREGWARSRLREGTEVYVAFATAPLSGWRIVLTMPVAQVEQPLTRALWQVLAGAAVAAAIAGGLAFGFGRRIAGAVGSLVRIAHAVERGQAAPPLRTGVSEVNVLSEQLRAAADLAATREREAAARERQARTLGEVAHALNASVDLDAVLRTAVEAARGLVGADFARIALVDESGRLVLRYSTNEFTAMPASFVIERGHGLGGLAWATGRPVRTDDFATDPRFTQDRYLAIALADGIVSCMAVPIATAGLVVGVIYANNVTRRPFTAEDERVLLTLAEHAAVAVQKARLLAAEHAARAEAEAASRGKDELLAMLGHELRNPLAAIANAVHVLNALGPEATRPAREIIARQNTHLARLVDDLLDVARVTSGKIALVRRPLELAEAVRRGMATLAGSGRTARHHVTFDLEPVWGHVDETRFEQIVTNLVGNAVKFTPDGGAIEVRLRASGGEAVLTVQDAGIGISAEVLPRVFDVFAQGGHPVHRERGGLGLGLTLVRRIADLHGGRVEAFSEGPGRGSTFTVHVPAIAAPAWTEARPPAPRPERARRILIVEDNGDARAMLRRALELAGHEVHDAADGPDGLASLQRLRPDVALIDVGLPGLDGYEVARKARAELGGAVRLVALTGYGQPEDRRRALAAGFDAHLVKPVEPEVLFAALVSGTRA
jgi:signal transduction histidine kinase